MNGFKIELRLDNVEHRGLSAIDFCRAMGLEERTRLETSTWLKTFIVSDEGFIRAWFDRDSCSAHACVSFDWLKPGEVVIDDRGVLSLSGDLPTDRAKELFVRARFRTLEKKLAELQEEREESGDDE